MTEIDLRQFCQGELVSVDMLKSYLETCLWSSTEGDNGEIPMDRDHNIMDFQYMTARQAGVDIDYFLLICEHRDYSFGGLDDSLIGHNFWLTRAGHGAGFWDCGIADGDRISRVCLSMPMESCHTGDDGKVYIG